jgi:hypothetical protein
MHSARGSQDSAPADSGKPNPTLTKVLSTLLSLEIAPELFSPCRCVRQSVPDPPVKSRQGTISAEKAAQPNVGGTLPWVGLGFADVRICTGSAHTTPNQGQTKCVRERYTNMHFVYKNAYVYITNAFCI